MFLPWTLFFVNLTLAVTRFLVLGAVGAVLTVYSSLRGQHGNSVRWVRHGGYLEMLSFLLSTRRDITNQAKAVLLFTIVATLASTLMARGVVRFVQPSSRHINKPFHVVNSRQYMPLDMQRTFSGWTKSIRSETNIIDTMVSMINGTNNIPNAVHGRIYAPRTSEYEVACDNLDIHIWLSNPLVLERGGCGAFRVSLTGNYHFYSLDKISSRSHGRYSIVSPMIILDDNRLPPSITGTAVNGGTECGMSDFQSLTRDSPRQGLIDVATTFTTKCVSPSGSIKTVSMSTIRFMSTTVELFRNTSKSTFVDSDELFQAMELAVRKDIPGRNMTLFTEIQSRNSTANILSCASNPGPTYGTHVLMCIYAIINAVILKQQDIDPVIALAREGRPFPTPIPYSIAVQISHDPSTDDGNSGRTSIAHIKNATAAAAQYFASLGQNFYMDWDQSRLVTVFDTTDSEGGIEIPVWLIVFVIITAVCCAMFWGLTEYFMDGRHTHSLYKTIAVPMQQHMNLFAPMLMRSKVGPLEFENIQVIAANPIFNAEAHKGNGSVTLSFNNSSATLVPA